MDREAVRQPRVGATISSWGMFDDLKSYPPLDDRNTLRRSFRTTGNPRPFVRHQATFYEPSLRIGPFPRDSAVSNPHPHPDPPPIPHPPRHSELRTLHLIRSRRGHDALQRVERRSAAPEAAEVRSRFALGTDPGSKRLDPRGCW